MKKIRYIYLIYKIKLYNFFLFLLFFITCSHVVTGPPVKMKTMAMMYSVPQTKRARAPPQRLTVASQGRQTSRTALRHRTTHTNARAATWILRFCAEMDTSSRLLHRPFNRIHVSVFSKLKNHSNLSPPWCIFKWVCKGLSFFFKNIFFFFLVKAVLQSSVYFCSWIDAY